MRCHVMSINMDIIQKRKNPRKPCIGENVEKLEPLCIAGDRGTATVENSTVGAELNHKIKCL